jgi:hypothetical protein
MLTIFTKSELWSRLIGLLAFITLILVVINMYLFTGNLTRQREVTERQQFIAQSLQMQGLAREIVAAVANLAVKNNDDQLKVLLTSHGITFSVNQPPGTPQKLEK